MPYKSIIPASHGLCPPDGSLSCLPQSLPSLLWNVTAPSLKNIAFFQQPPHSLNMWILMWNLLMSCPFRDITNYVRKA